VVTEKSISVTNLANGTTRLQPVVMQIGQAAGAIAALSVKEKKDTSKIGVRETQKAILASGGYIMPYLDVPPGDTFFLPLQRIGATGIMKGVGKNVAWSNETWFRAEEPLLGSELEGLKEIYPNAGLAISSSAVTVGQAIGIIEAIAKSEGLELKGGSAKTAREIFARFGVADISPKRTILRREMAVLLDSALDPFGKKPVDMHGAFGY